MADTKYASFAPSDMKEGGSLWDNVDARITGFKFTNEAPDNYNSGGVLIFGVPSFEMDGTAPIEERRVNNSFSLGAKTSEGFTISEDGYKLIPKTEDSVIAKDSKFSTFVLSLMTNGLPLPVLAAGDFSKIIGLKGHFKRVADKERNFNDNRPADAKKRPPTTLVCTKILELPGVSAAPVAAAGGDDSFDLDSATTDYLVNLLKAKGKPLQRSQLLILLSQAAVEDKANRAAIAQRGNNEDFLKSLHEIGIVKYDAAGKGQPVSLPVAA